MPKAMIYILLLLLVIASVYIAVTTIALWWAAGMIWKFIAANVFCYITIKLLNKEIQFHYSKILKKEA